MASAQEVLGDPSSVDNRAHNKALARTINNLGELLRKVQRFMKSGVDSDNQSLIENIAKELYSKLAYLRGLCESDVVNQIRFNELYRKVEGFILKPNAELTNPNPSLQFSFELFTGPEEAERAKEEEEKRHQEALLRSRDFGFDTLGKIPEFLLVLILQFLTSEREDVEIRHDEECEKVHALLCDKKHVMERVDSLLKLKYIDENTMHAKMCMMKKSGCSTCLSFSLINQMAHGLNYEEVKKTGYCPDGDLADGLLCAAMQFGNFQDLFLETYLRVMLSLAASSGWVWCSKTDERLCTLTIPNMIHAIANSESKFRENLIGSLTYYVGILKKRKGFQSRMLSKNDEHKEQFDKWREWYSEKRSNSAFKPFPFVSRELKYSW